MPPVDSVSYLRLVSGQDRSWRAAVLRALLLLPESAYATAMRARNLAYDVGWLRSEPVAVPVISVGNLTLGGTGKTPFVAWLARYFRRHGTRVSILSRGYGAEAHSRNDEAKALERLLPDVPHLQNPDRVAAAQVAIQELATQLILLDDGFQHRRLARDLDILLLDALAPFGYGHVFPRGLLREPISGLRRAQVAVLTRADLVEDELRRRIRDKVLRLRPDIAWAEVRFLPRCLVNASQISEDLERLANERVAAFCGIGNPESLRLTLRFLGCDPVAFRVFPDHHPYRREDVEDLADWLATVGATVAVCTEKDLVKVGLDHLGRVPLWALRIEADLLAGEEALEAQLRRIVTAIQNRPDPLTAS